MARQPEPSVVVMVGKIFLSITNIILFLLNFMNFKISTPGPQ